MKINFSKQNMYLLAICTLLLIIILFFSFAVLIPKGKEYRVKRDELIVIFNKKTSQESYSFFSIFTKERIGAGQFALAILMNVIVGVLFFLSSFREEYSYNLFSKLFWVNLPLELYFALSISFFLLIYFIGLPLISYLKRIFFLAKNKIRKE